MQPLNFILFNGDFQNVQFKLPHMLLQKKFLYKVLDIVLITPLSKFAYFIYDHLSSRNTTKKLSYGLLSRQNDISNKKESQCLLENLKKAMWTINEFYDLAEGWNGYNADRINENVIEFAKSLIKKIPVIPDIFPTNNGNIQFQFENSQGDYFECELLPNRKINFYKELKNGEYYEGQIDFIKESDLFFEQLSTFEDNIWKQHHQIKTFTMTKSYSGRFREITPL